MSYTITFPIPSYTEDGRTFFIPEGLARDVLAQTRFEPALRILTPTAREKAYDSVPVGPDDYPGLSVRQLPWNGARRTFPRAVPAIWSVLVSEARTAEVWHTACSTALFDLTHLGWHAGRLSRGLRVLGLDSEPGAMIAAGGGSALKAGYVRRRYRHWARQADLTVMIGEGVRSCYGPDAKRSVVTPAVWLKAGDMADPATTAAKFRAGGTVRMALPTRMLPWKGVDDVIAALRHIGDTLADWTLDIIGDGASLPGLKAMAQGEPRIRFLDPLPYGEAFFGKLRGYHIVLAPTRALEEVRIVFDAMASGCVIVHSATETLTAALLGTRSWSFAPGDVGALETALTDCIRSRDSWAAVAGEGLQAMRGRDIEGMHDLRAKALAALRTVPPA